MTCAWKELLAVLPLRLRKVVDEQGKEDLQEIRLRLDQPPTLVKHSGFIPLRGAVSKEELEYVVNMACRYSPWTAHTMAQGFITIAGGHRIGLCGETLIRRGRMCGIRSLSSVNIRVARDFSDISGNLASYPQSILIVGPPGSGKTTLLRDLIRKRSQRENVAVVDERGELFPSAAGFSKGAHTDVLSGCDKAQGMETLLRVMGPQCIAVDEITAMEDCNALIQAGKCGVNLLATAHGTGVQDLSRRPIYAKLLESNLFDRVVILQTDKSWRTERMGTK